MVKLIKRNGKLYAEYHQDGKRVRKSLKLDDTRNNVAYAYRTIIPQIEKKLLAGINDEKPFSFFTDKVLKDAQSKQAKNTYRVYEAAIIMFFNFFDKDVLVDKIRIRDIEEYIEWLDGKGLSSATINAYITPISKSFVVAMRREYIDRNPVQYAQKPTIVCKKKIPLTVLQQQNMLNRANGYLLTFLYFAFFTGARPNEILALTYGDVDDKYVHITKTAYNAKEFGKPKHGSARSIYLLDPLAKHLASIKHGNKNDRIIPLSDYTIRRMFGKLAEEVGVKGSTPHVTRHTFTSMLIGAKTNPTLVQWLLGHKDLSMINKVYAHYMENDSDATELEIALKGIAR